MGPAGGQAGRITAEKDPFGHIRRNFDGEPVHCIEKYSSI
jgi:hypothetical protein